MHLVSLRLEQEDYFYVEKNLLKGTQADFSSSHVQIGEIEP